ILRINGKKAELATGEETQAIVDDLDGATWKISEVTRRQTRRRPQAPFTTSTLQQEASRKLGYSVRRTMQLAQNLYEGVDLRSEGTQGLITYMRTDSVNISRGVQYETRDIIEEKFGSEYVPEKFNVYKTRSQSAQEAHEAIRPTNPARDPQS